MIDINHIAHEKTIIMTSHDILQFEEHLIICSSVQNKYMDAVLTEGDNDLVNATMRAI